MKKFLLVVLAVVFLSASAVEGFAAFVDLGDKNYSIPVDFSTTPSSISGSFGDLNSWEEFLRRFSSGDYSLVCVDNTIGLTVPSSLYVYRRSYTCSYKGNHTDYDYELYTSAAFPSVTLQCDKESNVYTPVSCSAIAAKSKWKGLVGTCKNAQNVNTFWHSFVYPRFNTGYSSYIRFLDANSLTLSVVPPSSYMLTINYLYNEATIAADPVTQTLAAGAEYSIPSPEIDGYTPSIPIVTGTMPDEDLTIDVYYSKTFHSLTVKYQYADGSTVSPDVVFQYPSSFVYDVPSPEVEGYQADKLSVSGTMGNEPLEVVVTYSPIPYTLTVNYQYTDGSTAAESHQEQLFIGASYSIPSPVIEGFHPNQTAVTGIMPARDVISTVTYREDPGGSGGPGPAGPGEGGGPGEGEGGDTGGEGGSGNDPFIPVLPPYSGNDPFIVPSVSGYSGNDPFIVPHMPGYSGYDPFIVRPPPAFYGYDPFKMPEGGGS